MIHVQSLFLIPLLSLLPLLSFASKTENGSESSPPYNLVFFASNGDIVFSHNSDKEEDEPIYDNWGIMDRNGNVIIDGKETKLLAHTNVNCYMEFPTPAGYFIFERKGEGVGILDKSYNEIIPPIYEEIELFEEYAVIKEKGSKFYRIIHIPTGKIFGNIPDSFTIVNIGDDLILAYKEDVGNCYIDMNGKIVISAEKLEKYKSTTKFHKGIAGVRDEDWNVGFIDKTGNLVIPMKYKYDHDFFEDFDFSEDLAILSDDEEKWGAIDLKGNVVIPFKFEVICSFENGKAIAIINEGDDNYKNIVIDKTGKILCDYVPDAPEYPCDEWSDFTDEETGFEGFKDSSGNVVLKPIYKDTIGGFCKGRALVRIDGAICLIDETGRILIKNLARWNQAYLPG